MHLVIINGPTPSCCLISVINIGYTLERTDANSSSCLARRLTWICFQDSISPIFLFCFPLIVLFHLLASVSHWPHLVFMLLGWTCGAFGVGGRFYTANREIHSSERLWSKSHTETGKERDMLMQRLSVCWTVRSIFGFAWQQDMWDVRIEKPTPT